MSVLHSLKVILIPECQEQCLLSPFRSSFRPSFSRQGTPVRILRAYHPAGTLAILLVVMSMGLNGCSPPAQPAANTTNEAPGSGTTVAARLAAVSALIARRLDLMPGVAQAKWNRKLPITDEKREQALLTRLAAEGERLDLPAAFVSEFFQAQITAAKLIQERAFEEWKSQQ